MINSVEEINAGTLAAGYDELNDLERMFEDERMEMQRLNEKYDKLADAGFGVWLDNCGDADWYCAHCLQRECGKRSVGCKLLPNGGFIREE